MQWKSVCEKKTTESEEMGEEAQKKKRIRVRESII